MLKIITIITSTVLISTTAFSQSIYTYTVTTIEGLSKPLNAYVGKKLLVITLPIQQNASGDSLLHSLDSIRVAYTTTLQIIAVPSYEDGYTPALKNQLQQWYRSILGMGIIVTEGMYTRKTSGNQQHVFFKWLTDKDKNRFFNQDVTGPKHKFIVWPNGELTAALVAQTRIGGTTMNNLLQGQ
jgi:glutathione peroxidase-family protein